MSNATAAPQCPVTREQFVGCAEPLNVTINGTPMIAEVKEFSTGSFGWYLSGKMRVTIDGKPVTVQMGCNFTVVGSKPR